MSNIVIFTTEFRPYPGGIATYVCEVCRAVMQVGHNVTIIVFGEPPLFAAEKCNLPVQIITKAPFSATQLPIMVYKMWRSILKARADVVIAADYYCITALGLLPAKARKIAVLHGTEVRGRMLTTLNLLMVYHPLAHFERIVANSEFTRLLALKHHPYLDAASVIAAPLGVDRYWFGHVNSDKVALLRRELKCPLDKIILLSVGRIEPRKGIEFAVRGVRELPEHIKRNVTYLIAGLVVDREYSARLDEEIKNAGADIRRLGPVPLQTLRCLYKGAHVLLHTAVPDERKVEGFGLVLLEAAAAGLPVISSMTDAIPEVVKHKETGLIVPPGDAQAISKALERLIDDRELHKKLSNLAPSNAAQYSWCTHVEKLIA